MKAAAEMLCISKEEKNKYKGNSEFVIKLGVNEEDEKPFVIEVDDKEFADAFEVGLLYRVLFKAILEDELSIHYLMKRHPSLTSREADDLLIFCKENTITLKECYGDGSIMYPKWKESIAEKEKTQNA